MANSVIRRLNSRAEHFNEQLDELLARDGEEQAEIGQQVAGIIAAVRQQGDQALIDYTARFDQLQVSQAVELAITSERIEQALAETPQEQLDALNQAAERIRHYHERQCQDSWQYQEADGTVLGQQITPLDRVGIYVPGGKAAYPSSVLMNGIPAKVAGVKEVIMVVPTPAGIINNLVLAAAEIAGVDRIFTIGGAQAVAALAWGTETIPRVDKIVGPGNCYVAAAKQQVFGQCGIDMIAGPSEVLIVADSSANPDWLAMDLFAQAEHDTNAQAILLSTDAGLLDRVQDSIEKLLVEQPRQDIIRNALAGRGALVQLQTMAEIMALVNRIAPEHLELAVRDPDVLLEDVRHAGAIFMGHHSAEALGDYCAGPNHVLPTAGTARFSSPLGVYDFQKRSSIIKFSAEGAAAMGKVAAVLADGEGLYAHAQSARYRI